MPDRISSPPFKPSSAEVLAGVAPQVGKARRVFLDLRGKILGGELPPDAPLTLRPLAQEYGTGINAVSEAVKALAAEGLVELKGKAGAKVIARDLNRIRGEFTLRIAIECEAARLCAVKADPVQFQILESLASRVDRLFAEGDQLEECRAADIQFHLTVAEFSGISQLRESLALLLDRLIALDQTKSRVAEIPGQKHLEVYEALKTRDPQVASETIRQHVEYAMGLSLTELFS